MRRSIVILAAILIASSFACSLIYRPSDYFDPTGQLTTIASGTEGANDIVLTSTLVVYATDNGIYSVPKTGGTPAAITSFNFGDLVAIAGDGENLVAWCGAMGVQAWRPGDAHPRTLNGALDCASIDAFSGSVAAAVSSDAGGGSAPVFQLYVYDGESLSTDLDAGAAFPQDEAGSGDRVAQTKDDLYYTYVAPIGLVARKAKPTDRLGSDPTCGIGLGGTNPGNFQVVEQNDSGPFILFRGKDGFRFLQFNGCCHGLIDGGSTCPADPLIVDDTFQSIVVHSPYVYYLPANELRRAPMLDPSDASTIVRSGLGDLRGSLAVDDDYAYVGSGNDIFKIALPP